MEVRASYILVGTVVLVLMAGLAAFTAWLVKVDVDQAMTTYEIAFKGSVTGLQDGGEVRYRGVPVGRVTDIRIDPDNLDQVLITVEIESDTPVKEDTVATLEMWGITGVAYVQLRSGSQQAADLEANAAGDPPRIQSRRSALEQVFESTPDLLARSLIVLERISQLFDKDNLAALDRTLANVATVSGALAEHSDDIGTLVDDTAGAVHQVEEASVELARLTRDLRQLTEALDQEVEGVGDDLVETLTELRGAASAFGGAAEKLDGMIGGIRQPLGDFAGSGLYELAQLVGETRVLVAALNRIATEFERDPTGFLLGNAAGGFQPE